MIAGNNLKEPLHPVYSSHVTKIIGLAVVIFPLAFLFILSTFTWLRLQNVEKDLELYENKFASLTNTLRALGIALDDDLYNSIAKFENEENFEEEERSAQTQSRNDDYSDEDYESLSVFNNELITESSINKNNLRRRRNVVAATSDGVLVNSESYADIKRKKFYPNPTISYISSTSPPVYSRVSRVMHKDDKSKAFKTTVHKVMYRAGDNSAEESNMSEGAQILLRDDHHRKRYRNRASRLESLDERVQTPHRMGRMKPLANIRFDGDTSQYVLGRHSNFNGNGHMRHPRKTYVDWKAKHWVNSTGMDQHFYMNNGGELTIKESGLYFIYAQIYYLDEHDTNGFRVYKNEDETVLQCTTSTHTQERTLKGNTCYTAGADYLSENDVISLSDLSDGRYSLFEPGKSFFGLIKLGDVKTKWQLKIMKGIWMILIIFLIENACSQDDSLRSALKAIDRREEDFSAFERPNDLAFINAPHYSGREFKKLGGDLDLENQHRIDDLDNKRLLSPFRERVEEQKQIEELAKNYLSNLEKEQEYNYKNEDLGGEIDDDYEDIKGENDGNNYEDGVIQELWEKYRQPLMYTRGRSKRYYPQMSIGESIGLRKRMNNFNSESGPYYYLKMRSGAQQQKRFPVTKRSSDHAGLKKNEERDFKTETDPKVAKELSNVFGPETSSKPQITEKVQHQTQTRKAQEKEATKEILPIGTINNEKPLQIKKKSIDWSDYFGLDRRKKADNNEWLIERYHKAMKTASKRNVQVKEKNTTDRDLADRLEEDEKIEDIDRKLKNMEDTIVDDTLKYTGAHQGATDSKQVQQVKNKVISRLAAAYSLEKMRNALGEYKLAIAKERERLKMQKNKDMDNKQQQEKRTSVPRKEAVDERMNSKTSDKNENENVIKCTQGNTAECLEQNYGLSSDLLEQHFGQDQCPIIEKACNEVSIILGEYGHMFEKACNMYEMCLICTNNIGMSPIHHCNSLFLAKANELCQLDEKCQREARHSLRFLLDINGSLQADPGTQEQCESRCPNMQTLSELFDLR
ncbi:unnamed protein product [Brassicogethes aeneus]|uniref:THD domain-containing protein n=1 Tax=Brassicogethes aeneus TaxID=1431903 RepID=A0A9P0BC41_BRAAE|nr:unnamed protein product [Brassicogethes aeneus]